FRNGEVYFTCTTEFQKRESLAAKLKGRNVRRGIEGRGGHLSAALFVAVFFDSFVGDSIDFVVGHGAAPRIAFALQLVHPAAADLALCRLGEYFIDAFALF